MMLNMDLMNWDYPNLTEESFMLTFNQHNNNGIGNSNGGSNGSNSGGGDGGDGGGLLFDPIGNNYFGHDLFESHLEHLTSMTTTMTAGIGTGLGLGLGLGLGTNEITETEAIEAEAAFLEPPVKRRKLNRGEREREREGEEEEENPSTPISYDDTTWNESPVSISNRGTIPPLLQPNPSLTSLSSATTDFSYDQIGEIGIGMEMEMGIGIGMGMGIGMGIGEGEEEEEMREDEKRSFSIPSLLSSISPPILKNPMQDESNIHNMLMMMNTNNNNEINNNNNDNDNYNYNYDNNNNNNDNDDHYNSTKLEMLPATPIGPASPPPPVPSLIASASIISSPNFYPTHRYKRNRLGYMNTALNINVDEDDSCTGPSSLLARRLEPELEHEREPESEHEPELVTWNTQNNSSEPIAVWNELKPETFEEKKHDNYLSYPYPPLPDQENLISMMSDRNPSIAEINTEEKKLSSFNDESQHTTTVVGEAAATGSTIKRKRGRPKGSKNKKTKHREEKEMELLLQTKRGRPKGSRSIQKPCKKISKKEESDNNDSSECSHYQYGNIPDLSLQLNVDKKQPFNHLWWYCAVAGSDEDITADEEYQPNLSKLTVPNVSSNTSTIANGHVNTNNTNTIMDTSRISSRFAIGAAPAINDLKFSIPSNLF